MGKGKFVHPKDQIVAFMQRIYDYGMTTTSGGNLSIMDADGCMWIEDGKLFIRLCDPSAVYYY